MTKDVRELKLNPDNPRTCSEFMEGKLIESLLVFPKMLELRPVLINKQGVLVGGNQRVTCLCKIQEMPVTDIEDYLFEQRKFRLMDEEKQQSLVQQWVDWQKKPLVQVRVLEDISEEEEKQLLVKDNMHYGEDDYEVMRKHFDRDSISDYFGSVPWNMYEYNAPINDKGLEVNRRNDVEMFKCGYVVCQITDAEVAGLKKQLEYYCSLTNGKTEGFLTYLFNEHED